MLCYFPNFFKIYQTMLLTFSSGPTISFFKLSTISTHHPGSDGNIYYLHLHLRQVSTRLSLPGVIYGGSGGGEVEMEIEAGSGLAEQRWRGAGCWEDALQEWKLWVVTKER